MRRFLTELNVIRRLRAKLARLASTNRRTPLPCPKLSKSQTALLSLIKHAARGHTKAKISYHSEYSGYLPFGQYHWVEIDGANVSDQIRDMDHVRHDLKQLVEIGELILVRGRFDLASKDTDEDIYIELAVAGI